MRATKYMGGTGDVISIPAPGTESWRLTMHTKSTPRRGDVSRSCERCGAEYFVRANETAIRFHCGRACRDASFVTSVQRTCLHCQAPFTAQPHEVRRGRGRFCSRSCGARHNGIKKWRDVEGRFWSQVQKTDGCWLWTGVRLPSGYGFLSFHDEESGRSRRAYAHQFAWKLASGQLPDNNTLHTCDTPSCVRNDEQGTYEVDGRILPRWGHLFNGTSADNSRDMALKGRGRGRHSRCRS